MTVPVRAAGRPPAPRRGDEPTVYGLVRPDAATARQSLVDAFADDPSVVGPLWTGLLAAAGLAGTETDLDAVDRLVTAFTAHDDPVVVLCGRALRIRLSTYTHLLAARRIISEEPS